ncbi:MAG: hypothetical protein IPG96_10290 [Proteobacteria bacterium]|nr:hypothetical protein [Pseudomonadota bacterium]
MRVTVDSLVFTAERQRLELRFCCESCAYFFAEPDARCAHGWPQAEHRAARYGATDERRAEVVFCKEFELG